LPAAPQIRAAHQADLLEIGKLSKQVQRSAPENEAEVVARHLSAYLSSGGSIFLATDESGEESSIDGYVLCRLIDPLFYAVDRSLILEVVFVDIAQRRRGIGHALLLAVANYARENGAGYVYATPAAADRGLHRFLASLGFAPIGANRVVSTNVLLRRLLREDPITQGIAIRAKARTPARTPIDEVIAKRKRARTSESPS